MTGGNKPRKAGGRIARGFIHAGGVLDGRFRRIYGRRGFAEARLLRNWPEVVGEAFAEVATPLRVSYGRGGFGATLTILVAGAHGPFIQMQLPDILRRINACYGYSAIKRIRITQSSPSATGVRHRRPATTSAKSANAVPVPSDIAARIERIEDPRLRDALGRLGQEVARTAASPPSPKPQSEGAVE